MPPPPSTRPNLATVVVEALLLPAVSEIHRKRLAPIAALIGVGGADRGDDGLPGQLYRITIDQHRAGERLSLRQLCNDMLALDVLFATNSTWRLTDAQMTAYRHVMGQVRLHLAREQAEGAR